MRSLITLMFVAMSCILAGQSPFGAFTIDGDPILIPYDNIKLAFDDVTDTFAVIRSDVPIYDTRIDQTLDAVVDSSCGAMFMFTDYFTGDRVGVNFFNVEQLDVDDDGKVFIVTKFPRQRFFAVESYSYFEIVLTQCLNGAGGGGGLVGDIITSVTYDGIDFVINTNLSQFITEVSTGTMKTDIDLTVNGNYFPAGTVLDTVLESMTLNYSANWNFQDGQSIGFNFPSFLTVSAEIEGFVAAAEGTSLVKRAGVPSWEVLPYDTTVINIYDTTIQYITVDSSVFIDSSVVIVDSSATYIDSSVTYNIDSSVINNYYDTTIIQVIDTVLNITNITNIDSSVTNYIDSSYTVDTIINNGTINLIGNPEEYHRHKEIVAGHGFTIPAHGFLPVFKDTSGTWKQAHTTYDTTIQATYLVEIDVVNDTLTFQQSGYLTVSGGHGLTTGLFYFLQSDSTITTTSDTINSVVSWVVNDSVIQLIDNRPTQELTDAQINAINNNNMTVSEFGAYFILDLEADENSPHSVTKRVVLASTEADREGIEVVSDLNQDAIVGLAIETLPQTDSFLSTDLIPIYRNTVDSNYALQFSELPGDGWAIDTIIALPDSSGFIVQYVTYGNDTINIASGGLQPTDTLFILISATDTVAVLPGDTIQFLIGIGTDSAYYLADTTSGFVIVNNDGNADTFYFPGAGVDSIYSENDSIIHVANDGSITVVDIGTMIGEDSIYKSNDTIWHVSNRGNSTFVVDQSGGGGGNSDTAKVLHDTTSVSIGDIAWDGNNWIVTNPDSSTVGFYFVDTDGTSGAAGVYAEDDKLVLEGGDFFRMFFGDPDHYNVFRDRDIEGANFIFQGFDEDEPVSQRYKHWPTPATKNNIMIGAYDGSPTIFDATTGDYNIGIGTDVFARLQGGLYNIGIGLTAGANMTGAANNNYNVLIGNQAGFGLTTVSNNVAIGFQSLATGPSSANSVAIGHQALRLSTSSNNTAVGYLAGQNTSSATQNTFIGYTAGQTITGSYNVAIGAGAGGGTSYSGTDNVAIGRNAFQQGGTGSFNVGIGSTTYFANGNQNIVLGSGAMTPGSASNSITANYNIVVGSEILASGTGEYSTLIGNKTLMVSGDNDNIVKIGGVSENEDDAGWGSSSDRSIVVGANSAVQKNFFTDNIVIGANTLDDEIHADTIKATAMNTTDNSFYAAAHGLTVGQSYAGEFITNDGSATGFLLNLTYLMEIPHADTISFQYAYPTLAGSLDSAKFVVYGDLANTILIGNDLETSTDSIVMLGNASHDTLILGENWSMVIGQTLDADNDGGHLQYDNTSGDMTVSTPIYANMLFSDSSLVVTTTGAGTQDVITNAGGNLYITTEEVGATIAGDSIVIDAGISTQTVTIHFSFSYAGANNDDVKTGVMVNGTPVGLSLRRGMGSIRYGVSSTQFSHTVSAGDIIKPYIEEVSASGNQTFWSSSIAIHSK